MNRLLLGYASVLTIHIATMLLGYTLWGSITKLLLMPCLLALILAKSRLLPLPRLLVVALIFSWFGDFLLLFPGEKFFILGLSAFLLAHLCFIWIFAKNASFHLLRLLPFLALIALLLKGLLLNRVPQNLLIPVYVYTVVITLMGILAAMQNARLPGYEQIVTGAVLFIVSDAFIAVDKFSTPVPWAVFWIMLNYGLAQYLIAEGCLMQRSEHSAGLTQASVSNTHPQKLPQKIE